MRDLRLYVYGCGTLLKFGNSKSKINNSQRHHFDDIDQMRNHIDWLKTRGHDQQFLIIEYSGRCDSKIIEVI